MTGATFVVICLGFGLAGGIVGKIKGSSFFIWFLVSTFVPIFGLLAALLYRWDTDEPRRRCPGCGKVLKVHDAICTSCGAELDFPDEVLPSRARERELERQHR